mmetsp:Transcript_44821/g.114584  ORF Transcript_44821/g.114584 Transcript_44821/m.114584 type:complete len:357 (-) Transcript_44821:714-1784(-)
MATRGMRPKLAAVTALAAPISASCSAVGSSTIAQSANTLAPCSSSMKKALLTMAAPGAVLMTCSAGLIVSAVVWMAPLTMPSAAPVAIIMVAYMLGLLHSCCVAASSVMPLALRLSASSAARAGSSSSVSGSIRLAAEMSTWTDVAKFMISSGLPRMVSLQMPRRSSSPAAVTTRLSLPSGRMMCCACRRAVFITCHWNRRGVMGSSGLCSASLKSDCSADSSTEASKCETTASMRSMPPLVTSCRARESSCATSRVSESMDRMGTSISPCSWRLWRMDCTTGDSSPPPLSRMPAMGGNLRERVAANSPRIMSPRPECVTISAPGPCRWIFSSTPGRGSVATMPYFILTRDRAAWP